MSKDKPLYDEDVLRIALNELRHETLCIDVTILCADKEYACHKVVLAATSQFFQHLFLGADAEEPLQSILLEGMDPSIMEVLLDFIYLGTFSENKLSMDRVWTLLHAGQRLHLENFNSCCMDALNRLQISEKNYRHVLQMCEKLHLKGIEDRVMAFLSENLQTMWMCRELLTFPLEQAKGVFIEAAKSSSHDLVLRAILSWWKHDLPTRRQDLSCLIPIIDFNLISKEYASFLLIEDPQVKDEMALSDNLMQVIDRYRIQEEEAKLENELKKCCSKLSQVTLQSQQPQLSLCRLLIFGKGIPKPSLVLFGRDEANRASLILYSLEHDDWTDMLDLNTSFEYQQGVTLYDENVYIIGGEDVKSSKHSTCYLYRIRSGQTHRLPDLRIPRSNPVVFVHDQMLYVAAGMGRYSLTGLSHMECLDISRDDISNDWRNVQSLRHKRDSTVAICKFNGCYFFIGGSTLKCEYFDPNSKTVHEIPSLPEEFHQVTPLCASTNDAVFVFMDYLPNRLFHLDRQLGWVSFQGKGTPPKNVSHAVGYDRKIYALSSSMRFYIFDCETGSWTPSFKVPRNLQHVRRLQLLD